MMEGVVEERAGKRTCPNNRSMKLVSQTWTTVLAYFDCKKDGQVTIVLECLETLVEVGHMWPGVSQFGSIRICSSDLGWSVGSASALVRQAGAGECV